MNRLTQLRTHAIAHLAGGGHGIGEGQHLFRLGVSLLDEPGNAVDQDRGLARAGSRDDQHRSMNVLNRFALMIVGDKRRGVGLQLRDSHRGSEYHHDQERGEPPKSISRRMKVKKDEAALPGPRRKEGRAGPQGLSRKDV
jgi:hypothetical protein